MGSNTKTQKYRERFLAREFLEHMEIPFTAKGLRSVQERTEPNGHLITGPDVKVTCKFGRKEVRIGIELTEYQIDAREGGSDGRRFDGFFRKIRQHLEPLLSQTLDVRDCCGYLVLKQANFDAPNGGFGGGFVGAKSVPLPRAA